MATIKFVVENNLDKAANSGKRFGKSIQGANKQMKGMSKTSSMLRGQVKGLITAYAGARGIQLITDSFKESAAAAMELSDAMTPLVALGDNVKNFKAVADEVNTLRTVFGATAGEVSELTFNVQSGGAALDKMTRDGIKRMSLLANKVAGFDTGSISKAALKSFNIFGKEVGSVTDVFNKFVITASDADANINELSGSMPELFAAAKGVGAGMDEALSSIIALTPSAGGASKAMIQLRNMFLILKDSQLKGTIQAENFKDQLIELGELPLAQQMQIMGRETFSSFTALTGATDIFQASMEKLGNTTGNTLLEMKKLRGEADIAFKIAQKLARFEEEKKIARGTDEAVLASAEIDQRTDQLSSAFKGALLEVAGFIAKGASYTPVALGAQALGGGDPLSEISGTLSAQAETEFVVSNLSRMNANQIASERRQQQTSLQLNKASGKSLQNNKGKQ